MEAVGKHVETATCCKGLALAVTVRAPLSFCKKPRIVISFTARRRCYGVIARGWASSFRLAAGTFRIVPS